MVAIQPAPQSIITVGARRRRGIYRTV
jgi:hypothetical protein